jgi:hypothetical protein
MTTFEWVVLLAAIAAVVFIWGFVLGAAERK